MDVIPSRCVSFALQAEETTTDDEILIDDHQHGTRGRETDRSEIVAGMEVGLESDNTDVHSDNTVIQTCIPRCTLFQAGISITRNRISFAIALIFYQFS